MPRTSNSIYACVIRFLLSQKHIRQTRTDRTLQDGEEPSKNQVRTCWVITQSKIFNILYVTAVLGIKLHTNIIQQNLKFISLHFEIQIYNL